MDFEVCRVCVSFVIIDLFKNRVGPLSRCWCMRYEAKHNYFKTIAHRIKSFKNISKAMANRHQTLMCYYLSNAHLSPIHKDMRTPKCKPTVFFVLLLFIHLCLHMCYVYSTSLSIACRKSVYSCYVVLP